MQSNTACVCHLRTHFWHWCMWNIYPLFTKYVQLGALKFLRPHKWVKMFQQLLRPTQQSEPPPLCGGKMDPNGTMTCFNWTVPYVIIGINPPGDESFCAFQAKWRSHFFSTDQCEHKPWECGIRLPKLGLVKDVQRFKRFLQSELN